MTAHRNTAALTPAVLALAALSWAGPLAAAPGGDSLCRNILARIRVLPPLTPSQGWQDPVQRLASLPDPYLRIDAASGGSAQADALAVRQFIAAAERRGTPDDVLKAMKAMDPSAGTLQLMRAGASSLYAISEDQGTMHCQDFVILDAPATGPVHQLPQPPQAQAMIDDGDEPTAFCYTDTAFVGVVAGQPAFIEENYPPAFPDYDISVSTWAAGRWTRPCAIKVIYSRRYSLADIHCQGAVCGPLRAAAPAIGASFDDQARLHPGAEDTAAFAWGPPVPARDRAKAVRLRAIIADGLPSLPAPDIGQADDQSDTFGERRSAAVVVLGGHAYLAVISHSHIGWRIYARLILGLYDLKDGNLVPVAGAFVDQFEGPIAEAALRPWPPAKPTP